MRQLLAHHGAADLITSTSRGLLATLLPFVHDDQDSRTDMGPWGALLGHVARNNEQWREAAQGEALVIVRGPDAIGHRRSAARECRHAPTRSRASPFARRASRGARLMFAANVDGAWMSTRGQP